jgi:hypothetical protein
LNSIPRRFELPDCPCIFSTQQIAIWAGIRERTNVLMSCRTQCKINFGRTRGGG